ncbi:MAG: phosphotransferase [Propionibacteriaceae bacterium]|nr:phosphotransferase [Propionibacteriaceae bacterium]
MAPGWTEYLRRSRWFAGKDEGRLTGIEPLDWYTPVGALPAVRSELARVERQDGEETYHLLVGYLSPGSAEPHALVDRIDLDGFGDVDVVDAPASLTAMEALLDALKTPGPSTKASPGSSSPAPPDSSSPASPPSSNQAPLPSSSPRRRGSLLSSHPGWRIPASAGMTEKPDPVKVSEDWSPVRLLSAEQSNSAVIAGGSLVKIYRRLSEGPNPEPELLAALTGGPVPALRGVLSQRGYDLLAAIEFLAEATDGWEFATAACGSDRPIDDELTALGRALRDVHDSLAGAFGTRTGSGAALRERLLEELGEAVAELPELEPHREALASVLAALPDDEFVAQRVHGDFHLGQTLLTADGWRIIDFEGEPGAPMAKRREFDSPWRDVAGLLRSLDYARSAHAEPSGSRATAWYRRSRDAFLAGYGNDLEPFGLLAAHEVARMVYEVGYEVRNRPDWVGIPLSAVENVATRH